MLTSPAIDLSDCGGKVTVKITASPYKTDNNPNLKITCGSSSETIVVSEANTDFTVVLDAPTQAGQKIEFATIKNGKRVIINHIEIHNGDVSEAKAPLRAAAEQGDALYRLITGITAKTYTIQGLTPAKTYRFKVKPVYIDQTEGNWTKNKQVTLQGQSGIFGDIDGNGKVDVGDVNILVNIILGKENNADYISHGDVDGDGKIDVGDVNLVVNIILGK